MSVLSRFRSNVGRALYSLHDVVIFGEMHTTQDRDEVEDLLRQFHQARPFHFILSEELGEGEYYTNAGKQKAIKDMMYSISDRTLALGVELNIPVVGIDLWAPEVYQEDEHDKNGEYVNCARSFALREAYMVKRIREFNHLNKKTKRIAVIVGDTHLRTIKTKELGNPSPLNDLTDLDVMIIRSPSGEVK